MLSIKGERLIFGILLDIEVYFVTAGGQGGHLAAHRELPNSKRDDLDFYIAIHRLTGKQCTQNSFPTLYFSFTDYLASIGVLSLTDTIRIYAGGVRNHVFTVISVKDLYDHYIIVNN